MYFVHILVYIKTVIYTFKKKYQKCINESFVVNRSFVNKLSDGLYETTIDLEGHHSKSPYCGPKFIVVL